jgi:tRNA(fMet)-specific endonuclease VapC
VKILLDTNTYTLFKSGKSKDAVEVIDFADEIGLPNVVIGELYSGFYGGAQLQKNIQALEDFLKLQKATVVGFSDLTPKIFGEQQAKLRQQGINVPHNDLWIAALAIEHGFVVYSLDKHLKMIPTVSVIQSFDEYLDLI